MRCFSLTETAVPFLRGVFSEDGTPTLAPADLEGRLPVELGPQLAELLTEGHRECPTVRGFRLGLRQRSRSGVAVTTTPHGLTLGPSPRAETSQQALVRVQTAAGVGGMVQLTPSSYRETLVRGVVEREFDAFPAPGVTPLCTDAYLARMARGEVTELDLFVVLSRGASFRIRRTGRLEGASPTLQARWSGEHLRVWAPGRRDFNRVENDQ